MRRKWQKTLKSGTWTFWFLFNNDWIFPSNSSDDRVSNGLVVRTVSITAAVSASNDCGLIESTNCLRNAKLPFVCELTNAFMKIFLKKYKIL